MMTSNELLPWLAAIGLSIERLWKIYTDRKALNKDNKAISISEGDSLFKRATELMDRLQQENTDLRKRLNVVERDLEEVRCQMEEDRRTYNSILSEKGLGQLPKRRKPLDNEAN